MQTQRPLIVLVITLILVSTVFSLQKEKRSLKGKSRAAKVSFTKNVFPIIKLNCLPCHSEDEMNASELYMTTYDGLMKGGKHGSPIVPGKADSSILVKKLRLPPPFGDPMPMRRPSPISADTINVIRKWINQGAKNN